MKPLMWLGATSVGGLTLPDAQPTPSQIYAPRGVFMNDDVLIAVDSGNHRVMMWHGLPTETGQPADVVLGQQDFYSEGPRADETSRENGFHLPTGVGVYNGKLFLADAWHHRVLVWNQVPTESNTPPDYAIGQANLSEIEPNRGGEATATSLYWPYGITYHRGWFYIADTGNRRVLGWQGLPEPNQEPDLLLGQANFSDTLENRGGAVGANTFRWAHAFAGTDDMLYVADAGNHRILGWQLPLTEDCPADVVIGQADFTSAWELPYGAQGPQRLRFPYAIAIEDDVLCVADTANNRVLFWCDPPKSGCYAAADAVIAQNNFDENGENRWIAVEADTLCWPYGVHMHNGRLAVADSGNNRVVVWDVSDVRQPDAVQGGV
ncbi:MAG: hypothetical protein AAFU54_25985 [Chloroflexota bacterium]